MNPIDWLELSWCLIPVALVCCIYIYWQGSIGEIMYASSRMLIQLLAMGYALVAVFNHPSPWISIIIVSGMLCVAAWIAIRPVRHISGILLPAATALIIAIVIHLGISLFLVLNVTTWYAPQILIPLAGMYLANSMNAISISTERFYAELAHNATPQNAKIFAFKAAMIPQINSLLAVGLVALPGMMTGQILSGVSPLVAVRYQIMIMTMILGTTGLGSAIMLSLLYRKQINMRNER
jgi:putative ABC transport system permease protein